MNSRYLGALLLSPFIIFLFLGGVYLKYGIMVLSLFGMYEFYKVIKNKNINAFSYIGYLICILYYIFWVKDNINFEAVFFILALSTILVLIISVLDAKHNFIDGACTIFGFLYVGVCFSFITLLNTKQFGNYLIWLVFISSWLCDTSAYYFGRAFGKIKICPKVSPNKTIAGSLGGLLGSVVACTIFGIFVISKGVSISLYHFSIIGLLCGILCQFGDLAASSIKRYVDVKDYSNLIPGHGGILDRFDSILFASLTVYYYITFIVRI